MNCRGHIERRPGVMAGRHVFIRLRITVENVPRELGRAMGHTELLARDPRLTAVQIRAAIAFAADSVGATAL